MGINKGILSLLLTQIYPTVNNAISILSKYGGSLWVADPAYTFTRSDGTGVAGDGSDAGYVRDLCATYGSELVINGDFSQGAAGWALTQPTSGVVAVVNGRLRINSDDDSLANAVQYNTLTIGKLYQVTGSANIAFGSVNVFLGSGTPFQVSASGDFSFVGVCSGTANMELKRFGAVACDASFDNISVREIIGRPLFQATTSFKPKLKRVPKKLGPELVTNGTFDNDISGWYRAGTTTDGSIGWSAGKLQCARLTADAMAQTTMSGLLTGKQYQVSVTGAGAGFTVGSIDASVRNFTDGTVASFTVTATSHNLRVWPTNTNSTVLFDNISVREVLEWGWAWVFDGVDDALYSSATTGASGVLIASFATSGLAWQSILGTGGVQTSYPGVSLSLTGVGEFSMLSGSAAIANSRYITTSAVSVNKADVVTAKWQNSAPQVVLRRNGIVQSNRMTNYQTQSVSSSGIFLGKLDPTWATDRFSGNVFAAAYSPVAIPDAELMIVERAMAQLGGITI